MTDPSYTVSRLGRRFGLSRSTLLYYDRIGLLRPSGRSAANYRRYGRADAERLAQICAYRAAGVPLADIRRILERAGDEVGAILERRVAELNHEIDRLRAQQDVLLRILRRAPARQRARRLGKAEWTGLLRAAGLDEAGMRTWHAEFERHSPDAHRAFLASLHLPPADVRRIRAWARRAPRG